MQWFDPEPQIKGLVFAKKLRDLGNHVAVLTGFPNYPGGRLYPGYAVKLYQVEMMDGIAVLRVPLYPSHDTSAFRRILNYASFGASSFFAGLLKAAGKDVIYACGPPVTVGVSAALVGMLRGVPFVYDIQDLWPDSLGATGMFDNSLGLRVVSRVCDWVYRRAARITVQSPGVRDRLVARGVDSDKISVIYNWCDEAAIVDCEPRNDDLGQINPRVIAGPSFDVVFAGNMGKAQALDAVLAAAEILKTESPSVRLCFLGGGVEVPRLKEVVADRAITNVDFLPRVPMSEAGIILASADALLVHLDDDPLFSITVPAKTQAYLAAGKPVVMAVAGDAAQVVRESGSGVCAMPGDARSIASAIGRMAGMPPDDLRRMGESGRKYYREYMSMDVGVSKFEKVFQGALGKNEPV